MLHIPCPWCGPRDETEFTYGGDGTLNRPEPSAEPPLDDWIEYIYRRDNPKGPHLELWHHSAGCRQWFRVHRDTATHRILEATAPGVGSSTP